ncbi:sensor histidine kinase [Magnetospirillum sp. UT-4]|uniref:sensor histidine kinase n=1 Tax=Magnetospirillum sp. UT-4 TaxID=2681467 RepID=UPI00137F2D8C|nr:ATP-binding protein [Magnetospirillum sp. UT-4]CAA7623766.1 putative Two-component sensor histidine kinase [Magnetospirillum sp. UT-4]
MAAFPALRAGPWPRRLLAAAGALALYAAAEWAALGHSLDGSLLEPWNAGFAVSFGLVARYGFAWLPVAAAAPLLAGWGGAEADALVVRVAAEAAACAAAAAILRRRRRERPDIGLPRTVLRLFAAALAAAAMVAVMRGAAIAAPPWQVAATGAHLLLAHLVAVLLVAPLFLVSGTPRQWLRDLGRPSVETLLQVAALSIIAWEVFGRFVNEEVHFFYLLFLPLAWIATRHGQAGTALALAAVQLAPVVTDRLSGHADHAIVELQIRLAVLAVTSLLLGAMASERRQADARMLERQTELAHFQRLNVGWEMASALAHELNQPLTAAMNYTQAAQRLIAAPGPDLERAGRAMSKSVDQIERVGDIIHGLRDFMRKGELRLARNRVREVVDDALRLVSAEANASGIALNAAGLSALPPVMADKTQIVQVLVNLIRNAVQALAGAGTPAGTVAVSGRAGDGWVELAVADNGPGLPPEVLAKLFEPFVTTRAAGMGLGLSISKSILEAHDGRLWAETLPQGGAVFRFTLPVAAAGEMADA